ncbi:RagB/SusD family nutrient uptake outer membrane protein [Hymenobacter sp.]|jgi:tetratricopeptide (TPR) repeat protein|uniref:RagB/SusD family nutrient uptake outer membrane protein n=1 Tax=Hymenobacter sp. TaxID=1898978 RepID=UPI002ED82FDD
MIIQLKKALAAGCVLLSLTACEDKFLDIQSETSLTTGTFFKTQADFQSAVNGIYQPLRGLYSNAFVMGEMHSDNTYYIYNPSDRGQFESENIAEFILLPTNGISTNKYVTNYRIISRANQVLSLIDAATFDETARNTLKGEALFLRAMAYFELVRYFGSVPLHLTPVTDRSQAALPLASPDDVYKQIVADAQQAATLLPGKKTQIAGRATSGAAKTLLGDVYMVQKQYALAETVLKEVVASGDYTLLPNYAAVFDPTSKNNGESVFEVQYQVGSDGYASNFIYQFLPRPIAAATVGTLTGVSNPQGLLVLEAFNTPTPDLIAAYEPNDRRKEVSIGTAPATDGTVYPFVKKYLHPHTQFGLTNDNWPVYRYAEVLLLLAEALTEQGKTAEAVPLLNQIRTRAGLAGTTQTSQAGLRDAIARERRVELAFENKRWLDLVRTGKAVEVMTAHGVRIRANPRAYYLPAGVTLLPAAYSTIPLTFPLPASEAQLSAYF